MSRVGNLLRLAVAGLALVAIVLLIAGTDFGLGFKDRQQEPETTEGVGLSPPAVPSGPLVLVAGTPGSDLGQELLLTYSEGAWHTVVPANVDAGRGYFAGEQMQGTLLLSSPPVRIVVSAGWNLVGNSSSETVALPEGFFGFVLGPDRTYSETMQLSPGQGAWVHADGPGEFVLEPLAENSP